MPLSPSSNLRPNLRPNPRPNPRPLIIDCDPGIDDAIALFLALASPQLDLLGITTVAGNVSVETTTTNARCIGELAEATGSGRGDRGTRFRRNRPSLPIYPGCPRPLLRDPIFADHVHGRNGLGGVRFEPLRLPPPGPEFPQHGVDFLRESLRRATQSITLATLGPLTNLACALIQAPDLLKTIDRIVIMGGAMGEGNVTASAEFNFYADPHAAQIVLHTAADYGVPVVVIPLDVTHRAIATPERRQALRDLGNPVAATVAAMLDNYGLREQRDMGFTGPPLHDPCVIAYLLQPELFETERLPATIEVHSPLTQGRLVIDRHGDLALPGRIELATGIDADGFYQLLTEALGRFN